MQGLADLADAYGSGRIRFTVSQDAIVPDIPEDRLPKFMAEPLVKRYSPAPSPFFRNMVACTGTDFCNLAQIETKTAAVKLSRQLETRLGPDRDPVSIHWSGCPAACGNHQAADIGLRGMKVNVEGRIVDAVAVYVGGTTGPAAKPGTLVLDMVPCDEVLPDVVARIIGNLEWFKQVERDPRARERVLMIPALLPGGVEIPWQGEES
jgi:ferredoxin-nitrite reductase